MTSFVIEDVDDDDAAAAAADTDSVTLFVIEGDDDDGGKGGGGGDRGSDNDCTWCSGDKDSSEEDASSIFDGSSCDPFLRRKKNALSSPFGEGGQGTVVVVSFRESSDGNDCVCSGNDTDVDAPEVCEIVSTPTPCEECIAFSAFAAAAAAAAAPTIPSIAVSIFNGAAVLNMLITEAGKLPPSSVCAVSVTLQPLTGQSA